VGACGWVWDSLELVSFKVEGWCVLGSDYELSALSKSGLSKRPSESAV